METNFYRGRLTAKPELTFASNGTPRVTFSIASNKRVLDRTTNEWRDQGETRFLNVVAWRHLAENLAGCEILASDQETAWRGVNVVVEGELIQRSYETRDGEKRVVFEVVASDVLFSTRNAEVKIAKVARGAAAGQQPAAQSAAQPAAQPVAQPAMAQQPVPAGAAQYEQPPF